MNIEEEKEITAYDFAQMKTTPLSIIYKDNGDDIEFYGAFENRADALSAMSALNGTGSLYEMLEYFVDTETCLNAYPNVEFIHFGYGVSDMVGLVPGGSFAAANIEDGDRAANKSAEQTNDLLSDCTFPVFAGVHMRAIRIPFYRSKNRKSQA